MAGACICFSVFLFLFLFSMHYVIVFSLGDPRGFRFSGGFELIEFRVFLLLKWLPPTAISVLRGPQPSIVSLPARQWYRISREPSKWYLIQKSLLPLFKPLRFRDLTFINVVSGLGVMRTGEVVQDDEAF